MSAYKAADVWKEFANIKEFDATGIDEVNAGNVAIKTTVNGISLSGADGKAVAVYTTDGTCVAGIDSYAGNEIILDNGVYIVRVGNKALKVKL